MEDKFDINDFADQRADLIKKVGFMEDISSITIRNIIMRGYKREFIKQFYLTDIVPDGANFILKWQKRYNLPSEEELNKLYNPE